MRFKFFPLLIITTWLSASVFAQSADSIINFVFTSDVHFGLSKEKFQNKTNVSAYAVNNAMKDAMNTVMLKQFPDDRGVQAGQPIKGVDALIITGDIANRMENGVQSATKSWQEFKAVYIDGLRLTKSNGTTTALYLVPGNHDMSNAIGFHRKMEPQKDPAAMLGMYNFMFPDQQQTIFDSTKCRIHYSRNISNIHFIFLSLYPDSAERVWMEHDLASVSANTPVLLFAHSPLTVEPRFFVNPNGDHGINETDKFENLVPEMYKDGSDVKGVTTIEQNAFVSFIKKHPNIKVYFHGHENFTEYYSYTGPNHDISLNCIRTDSPMKGRSSAKDETKLAYEIVTINVIKKTLTVREVLWNATSTSGGIQWGKTITINL